MSAVPVEVARIAAVEMVKSAKWYAGAAVLGALAGLVYGYFDYQPPNRPYKPIQTPFYDAVPTLPKNVSEPGEAPEQPALMAQQPKSEFVAVRKENDHCVTGIRVTGFVIRTFCLPDQDPDEVSSLSLMHKK